MARKSVKVSAILDVNLHSRLCVAASLRGMTKNAILTDALTEYLKGIVAFDRGKKSDRSGTKEVIPDEQDPANLVDRASKRQSNISAIHDGPVNLEAEIAA